MGGAVERSGKSGQANDLAEGAGKTAPLNAKENFEERPHRSLCDCAFGPRCESNRGCEDATATMGIRCPRLGVIRARADWLILLPGRPPRPRFYCAECLEALREAVSKPLVGIDRPEHASDFWRPSLTEHIRLTAIENSRQKQAKEPRADAAELERMRRWTPAQRSQAEFVRRQMRR